MATRKTTSRKPKDKKKTPKAKKKTPKAKKKTPKASRTSKAPSVGTARMKVYRAVRHGAGSAEEAREELLAAERAAATKAGWDDWQKALEAKDVEKMRTLVASGSSPNVRASFGDFPLHFAAFRGELALVRALLELGANLEQTDFEGESALFAAAFKGHSEVVDLLLDKGARAGGLNQFKQSPADRAAKAGHSALAKKLAAAAKRR